MKKLFAITLVLVLALSLLTACGGGRGNGNGGNPTSANGNNAGGQSNAPGENPGGASQPAAQSGTENVKLSLDKETYAAGEKITIAVSGVTEQMVNDRAFVSIYKAGAAHDEYGQFDYLPLGAGILLLDAPEEHGAYEMRIYSEDFEYRDETLVAKVPFTIGG